jgi:hypothetical protein
MQREASIDTAHNDVGLAAVAHPECGPRLGGKRICPLGGTASPDVAGSSWRPWRSAWCWRAVERPPASYPRRWRCPARIRERTGRAPPRVVKSRAIRCRRRRCRRAHRISHGKASPRLLTPAIRRHCPRSRPDRPYPPGNRSRLRVPGHCSRPGPAPPSRRPRPRHRARPGHRRRRPNPARATRRRRPPSVRPSRVDGSGRIRRCGRSGE